MSRQPHQPALFPLMLSISVPDHYPVIGRFMKCLPLLLLGFLLPQAAFTQQVRPTSPSVVLVLKLVSATHVKPTTGIVISDDGLVLISAEFVSSGGEIIVLDGGTDIVKHGRPASIVKQSGSGSMALLSVDGLTRTGITLSENILNKESELHLAAFPPAEYIAKGAPPLWASMEILQEKPGDRILISPATPLPYVSGPILDTCGYLSGISLTSGPQSLKQDKAPLTFFATDLKDMLDSLQVKLPSALCAAQTRKPEPPAEPVKSTEMTADTSAPKQAEDSNLIKPEVYNPFVSRKRLNPFQGATPPPPRAGTVAKPSLWLMVPWWLILIGFISLAALVWKGTMLWRLYKGDVSAALTSPANETGPTAPVEPDTAPLHAVPHRPRSVPLDGSHFPDLNALPDGCDGLVVVDGLIDGERSFRRFCAVDTKNINIIIGRAEADININHPVISRVHARLESTDELMTLSDLGSDSGTFIGRMPCLQGEIMYVGIEDEIFLGDVQIRFNIIRKEADLS